MIRSKNKNALCRPKKLQGVPKSKNLGMGDGGGADAPGSPSQAWSGQLDPTACSNKSTPSILSLEFY